MTMTTATKPRHRPSIWKPSKSDDALDQFSKLRKNKTTHISIGQALTLAALSAAFAAVVTALIAVECFSSSLPDIYTDQLLTATTRGVISHTTLLHPAGSHVVNAYDEVDAVLPTAYNEAYVMMPNAKSDRGLKDDGVPANIAWLMSFPNR
jgi:hypothetical protein